MQKLGDAQSMSSVLAEPSQSNGPSKKKPRKKKKNAASTNTATSAPTSAITRKDERGMRRAIRLRNDYPNMKNIPNSITLAQRKKLILDHTQNTANLLPPTHSATTQVTEDAGEILRTLPNNSRKLAIDEQQRTRATMLKMQYPNMKGIPAKIGKGTRKKLIDQFKAASKARAPSMTKPTSSKSTTRGAPNLNELPTRLGPAASTEGMNPISVYTQSHATLTGSLGPSNSASHEPTSHKMAPLSEERLAEVARNLAAGSNDDPVMID